MNDHSLFWIMSPFNHLFIIVSIFFILLLVLATRLMKNRTDRTKRTVIVSACILTLIGFIVYKIFLSLDSDFNVITSKMGGFNWWGELPLQLCNINMIMIPIAVLTRKRPLLSFCFFVGPLGALMALIMPGNGFDGYSLLLPRMLGYYGTHFFIIIEALAIVTFGLYRPKFRDLPLTALALLVIALIVFGFNMLLRFTGLHPKANYFFSVETEGNFLLEMFYKILPYPFLYLLPSIVILGVYMALVTSGFSLADKIKNKN